MKERYGEMGKTVVFSEKDEVLIEKIETYQKAKGLDFADALKELCEIGLAAKDSFVWGEMDK